MTSLPPLNFVTLACNDVARMTEFLRAVGWEEAPESDEHHRVFQLPNGLVVALYAAANYEAHFGSRTDGFRGFTLGVNVATPEEVDAAYDALAGVAGAELLEAPFDSPHGFRGFSFRDPEGNVWDVAWKREATVTESGDLTW